jgi:sterol desaturase/sphingolipid hydroxylase (fatty acid hydroxylase superfamily)
MRHLLHHQPHGFPGLLLLSLAAIVVEAVWRLTIGRKGYDLKGAAVSIGVSIGHLVFEGLGSVVLAAAFAAAAEVTPLHWSLRDWRTWTIGFVAVEFAYYWSHRLSHEVRWMWASHVVHHTPEQITLLSAVRLGWTNLISAHWLVYLPVVLLGFDPRLVILILALDLRYQFFLHTEADIRLGPLEWVLNTPAHHQVHHASNPDYVDRNYGGAVIVFDRLFGTFAQKRAEEPPRYGLVRPLGSDNPFVVALGEWGRLLADMRRAPGLVAAARVALGRPA